jgi:uncharacterized membrane protein YjfL (UPF0719 family)
MVSSEWLNVTTISLALSGKILGKPICCIQLSVDVSDTVTNVATLGRMHTLVRLLAVWWILVSALNPRLKVTLAEKPRSSANKSNAQLKPDDRHCSGS